MCIQPQLKAREAEDARRAEEELKGGGGGNGGRPPKPPPGGGGASAMAASVALKVEESPNTFKSVSRGDR